MQITKNFTLAELTKTSVRNVDNSPNAEQLKNLKTLTEKILQPLRDKFGATVVNSALRVEKVNKIIGGSPTSQHTKGEAVDVEVLAISNYELAVYIRDNMEFDQLILEFPSKDDPRAGWVHVSYTTNGKNRKQVLTATSVKGKTTYTTGLPKW